MSYHIGDFLLSLIVMNDDVVTFNSVNPVELRGEEVTFYEFVSQHYHDHGQIPHPETVLDAGCNFTYDVIENVSHYRSQISKRYKLLAVHDMTTALNQAVAEDNINDIDTLLRESSREILMSGRSAAVSGGEMATKIVATAVEGQRGGNKPRVMTGYSNFDMVTHGLRPDKGEMLLIYARMKRAKTWIALNIALNAWLAGSRVQLISMEMDAEEIMERVMAILAGLAPDVYQYDMMSDHAVDRLRLAAEQFMANDRFSLTDGAFNLDINGVAIEANKFNPDLLVIDGAYMIKPSTSVGNRATHEILREIISELKTISKAVGCVCLPVVQLNRAGSGSIKSLRDFSDDPLDIANISGSDAFAMYANFTMGIDLVDGDINKRRLKLTASRRTKADYHHIIKAEFTPPAFEEYCTVEQYADMLDLELEADAQELADHFGL